MDMNTTYDPKIQKRKKPPNFQKATQISTSLES